MASEVSLMIGGKVRTAGSSSERLDPMSGEVTTKAGALAAADAAAVLAKDAARGLRVAKQIRSGICHINGSTVHDEAQMPFGGVNASGYGRFGGGAGTEAITNLRWITIETLPGHFTI